MKDLYKQNIDVYTIAMGCRGLPLDLWLSCLVSSVVAKTGMLSILAVMELDHLCREQPHKTQSLLILIALIQNEYSVIKHPLSLMLLCIFIFGLFGILKLNKNVNYKK